MTRLICTFTLSILLMAVVQFWLTALSIKYPIAPWLIGTVVFIGLTALFNRKVMR